MNKQEFFIELSNLGIKLNDKQKNQLEIYKDFLQEYNRHTNLTTIIEDNDIYLKHFYDSISVVKYINISNISNLLDIGTGAGFPGMVIKIIFPNISVTLLDSNNKKIEFLKQLSEKLDLDVELINERAEEFIINRREYYDIVISRAVAFLPILLELAIPYVKINGHFISMKGNADEELEKSKTVPKELGAKLESVNKFLLIKENSSRTIIIYKKIEKSPFKYPRSYDKIKKHYL